MSILYIDLIYNIFWNIAILLLKKFCKTFKHHAVYHNEQARQRIFPGNACSWAGREFYISNKLGYCHILQFIGHKVTDFLKHLQKLFIFLNGSMFKEICTH